MMNISVLSHEVSCRHFKKGNRIKRSLFFPIQLLVLMSVCGFVSADVRLPNIFSDSMVLQRDMELKIWGWADPGETVKVSITGEPVEAKADAAGEWRVKLPAMKAGGPYEMTVSGKKNTLKIHDILVGEVWICSGQSNMRFELKHVINAEQELKAADYPMIRMLKVPYTPASLPVNDVKDPWFVCSPKSENLANFSGVGYFFARKIFKNLNIPIGVISAAKDASQIEPWTNAEGLADIPALRGNIPGIAAAAVAGRKRVVDNLVTMEAQYPRARAAMELGRSLPPGLVRANMPPDFDGPFEGPMLYNGMIAPLVPLAIRGVLWYQGESNAGDGIQYFDKMKGLIGGWRNIWHQGDFPFYIVQITPNTYGGELPFLLEAQQLVMKTIPNTGMAASTDTCNASDNFGGGHPRNKQEIGRRLALWALAKDYGQKNLVYCGPQYQGVKVEGKKLRVLFDHVGGGLITRDQKEPDSFEIAGADGTYYDAVAIIDGPSVVLANEKVSSPTSARFAWKDLAWPNLINKEGLPVSVFRTDLDKDK